MQRFLDEYLFPGLQQEADMHPQWFSVSQLQVSPHVHLVPHWHFKPDLHPQLFSWVHRQSLQGQLSVSAETYPNIRKHIANRVEANIFIIFPPQYE